MTPFMPDWQVTLACLVLALGKVQWSTLFLPKAKRDAAR